ncbi:MAG TPA: aminotransferase class I/II-fold pyridoxal phosphate-dependent enzyme [Gaiellaceae bacterium]|nr:aminotransferase class I/II-fold pyridoxal phosphate-dependent enzyme [Gaiellaceae bacterium]
MPLSPVLTSVGTYPFVRLEEAKRRVAARGVELIDFGVGDPRERTPSLIRDALLASVDETSKYPLAEGLPELREAIAAWVRRRFGVRLDPARQVIPTLGSKEAIFSLGHVVVDRDSGRNVVAYTEPGYPVYERGARFAGAEPVALPLLEQNAFLPDLSALDLGRLAILWLNYPNNPTGAVAPREFLEQAAALARENDFVLAADEAYTELWFDEPPPSALQVRSLRNVVVFNTLSKRSSMTGYRSGFAAGDDALIGAMRAFRPTVGTAPQEFVQRASVVAWGDEAHVEEARALYRAKRDALVPMLEANGLRVAASRAGMYLWVEVEGDADAFAERLLEHGVVVSPGSFFGPSGEGYVRFALVPSLEDCRRAASLLEEAL